MKFFMVAEQHGLDGGSVVAVNRLEQGSTDAALCSGFDPATAGPCLGRPFFRKDSKCVDDAREAAEQDGLEEYFFEVRARLPEFTVSPDTGREGVAVAWPDGDLGSDEEPVGMR